MPIEISRIEARIYRYQVIGDLTLEELQDMAQRGVAMAEEADENPHIRLIDASKLKRIPIDVQQLMGIVSLNKDEITQTMVVQAPSAARVMVQGVRLFVPTLHTISFHNNMDQAVKAARVCLADTAPDPAI